jgi:hypothetical protein
LGVLLEHPLKSKNGKFGTPANSPIGYVGTR